MKPNKIKVNVEMRPRQDVAREIVADLLGAIRGSFYGDLPPKRWFEDMDFLSRKVVLWPAGWLSGKGVSLPASRYKQILLDIVRTAKLNGDTSAVKYWPAYLAKCVQSHFRIHGEEYYEEGKSARSILDGVLLRAGQALKTSGCSDPIMAMADAKRALEATRAHKRPKSAKDRQLTLFSP
jgi:hypothetical protein